MTTTATAITARTRDRQRTAPASRPQEGPTARRQRRASAQAATQAGRLLRRSGNGQYRSENRSLDRCYGERPLLLFGDRASGWSSWLLYDPPEPCIVQETA